MPTPTRLRVLLVEDEPTIAIPLSHDLCDRGFDVTLLDDGADALARIANDRFDAVISDLRLPGNSGLEVLRGARRRTPGAPLLLVTAYAEDHQLDALLAMHVDVLLKPFVNDEVLGWLDAAAGLAR